VIKEERSSKWISDEAEICRIVHHIILHIIHIIINGKIGNFKF